jgi:hypothetical protein
MEDASWSAVESLVVVTEGRQSLNRKLKLRRKSVALHVRVAAATTLTAIAEGGAKNLSADQKRLQQTQENRKGESVLG